MRQELPEYVRCALCGVDNPVVERDCYSCSGKLPEEQKSWSQPAFERELLGSLLHAGDGTRCQHEWYRGGWNWLVASGETVAAVLFRPDRAFQAFRLKGGFAPPVAFVTAVGGTMLFLHLLFLPRFLPAESLSPVVGLTEGVIWWQIPMFFLAPAIYVYLRAQVVHLVLVFKGHAKEAFEVTFRVVAYGSASAALLLVVPVVGEFLFLATGVWIESTGLRRCHAISLEKAIIAEVIPAAILILGVLAVVTMQVFS